MARQKKLSTVLEKAAQRHTALASIDPALDLGGGLTVAAFKTEIDNARALQDEYNTLLSQVDGIYNRFQDAEKSVRELSQRTQASNPHEENRIDYTFKYSLPFGEAVFF
jgi:hypothetical protein